MGLDLAPWKAKPDPGLLDRIDAMARELARQAADITAAEYRWLRLLAEFDDLGGWDVGGARSCAAWLSWACGMSLPAARERVRVARALPGLPKVSAAFAAGRVSYSKVRALTRVATPANEELLVTYAQSATAAQLETVIAGYRRSQRAEEGLEAHRMYERRSLRWWTDDEGFIHFAGKFPPDDGALIVGELERLVASAGEDDGDAAEPAPAATRVSAETAEAGRGDAPVVSDRLDAAEPIAARRADALRIMAETAVAHGPKAAVGGDTHLVVVHASAEDPADVDTDVADAADPDATVGPQIENIGRVSAETVRRLGCDAAVVRLVEDTRGRPLGVGRTSRTVPHWLRRAVVRRDRGRCRFPSCCVRRFVDAHHIWHWADGGPTDLDNLVLLCRFHHRLVHEVGYSIRVEGPGELTFLRPDATVVPDAAPVIEGDNAAVESQNRDLGLNITWLTGLPDWDGHPPDYSSAIEALHHASAETPPAEGVG